MTFIRAKKIDGKEYAYLVENRWYKRKHKGKNKGSRQRVSKYLGRVYSFNKERVIDFYNFKKIGNLEQYIEENNKNQIVRDLIDWELFRHNIDRSWFIIDLDKGAVVRSNKEVSLKINEGFLNRFTLARLFHIRSTDGYYLAKCFVEAGIEIPKEVFVGFFG